SRTASLRSRSIAWRSARRCCCCSPPPVRRPAEQPRPARPRVGSIPPHGVPGMNKMMLLFPLALALAACTPDAPPSGPAGPMPPPADSSVPRVADSATLAGYHWRLASATDAGGARIDALFPGDDHVLALE